jgi:hypothetical protein
MLKHEGSVEGRGTQPKMSPKVVVIRKDQDTDLGPSITSIYRGGADFEAEPKSELYYCYPRNPNTMILGMSHGNTITYM